LFTDEKTFTVATPKNPQNDRLHTDLQEATMEGSRDKTPAQ